MKGTIRFFVLVLSAFMVLATVATPPTVSAQGCNWPTEGAMLAHLVKSWPVPEDVERINFNHRHEIWETDDDCTFAVMSFTVDTPDTQYWVIFAAFYHEGSLVLSEPLTGIDERMFLLTGQMSEAKLDFVAATLEGKVIHVEVWPNGFLNAWTEYRPPRLINTAKSFDDLVGSAGPISYRTVALRLPLSFGLPPADPSSVEYEEWEHLQFATDFGFSGWMCLNTTDECEVQWLSVTERLDGEIVRTYVMFAYPTYPNGILTWRLSTMIVRDVVVNNIEAHVAPTGYGWEVTSCELVQGDGKWLKYVYQVWSDGHLIMIPKGFCLE